MSYEMVMGGEEGVDEGILQLKRNPFVPSLFVTVSKKGFVKVRVISMLCFVFLYFVFCILYLIFIYLFIYYSFFFFEIFSLHSL